MTMPVKTVRGAFIERVKTTDSDYTTYSPVFNGNLSALFKIQYALPEEMKTNLENIPLTQLYVHGTGHCGCLFHRMDEDLGGWLHPRYWCSSHISKKYEGQKDFCATRGILTSGHLMTFSRGGHYFSPNAETAKHYAIRHSAENETVLAFFLCKARNVHHRADDIFFVERDQDILPVFLAIVKKY
ncbi:hypothetical protein BGZ83_002898 [Gryganskiella cystojenkinii]|nr:hypothetical protein BGZ83_002898 [Gryganskiella cystojenkinii]